jgi:hypothetical protein
MVKVMSSDHAKEKLFEALYALIGHGALDRRLTFAAVALVAIKDTQFPPDHLNEFRLLKAALTTTPLSNDRGYVDRQFTSDEAQTLARRILELFMAVQATKRRAKGK